MLILKICLILHTCSFQKMLSNFTCVLINLLIYVLKDGFKDRCVLKMMYNGVVAVFTVATSLNEVLD